MEMSQNWKRYGFKFSREIFFRILFLSALTLSVLVQYNFADADLKNKTQAASEDESPMTSDDYDPVDYLPAGLPPSKNDPATDIKS